MLANKITQVRSLNKLLRVLRTKFLFYKKEKEKIQQQNKNQMQHKEKHPNGLNCLFVNRRDHRIIMIFKKNNKVHIVYNMLINLSVITLLNV